MYPQFDRDRLKFRPLAERKNKVLIERDHVAPEAEPRPLEPNGERLMTEAIDRLVRARHAGKARMLTFGAHSIKNGLAPVIIRLLETGWLTHLATNGAGIIHDWEFAFQGASSEDVKENAAKGEFGAWQETGYFINLALLVGAYQGLGYGASLGAFVEEEALKIPAAETLDAEVRNALDRGDTHQAAAAADLLGAVRKFQIPPGTLRVPHPWKRFGLQAAAYRLGIPFTSHPMFGHDIIYEHPMNHGAAIGRCAERDFLSFAESVRNLDGGVYLSIGSAVMSPMVFEKSFSMSQNLALQEGTRIDQHYMLIVDLQKSHWDWTQGEPPETNPDYYLRYNKSFSRMGGHMRYLTADNRDFLLTLARALESV